MKCNNCGIETGPAFGLCSSCIIEEDARIEEIENEDQYDERFKVENPFDTWEEKRGEK